MRAHPSASGEVQAVMAWEGWGFGSAEAARESLGHGLPAGSGRSVRFRALVPAPTPRTEFAKVPLSAAGGAGADVGDLSGVYGPFDRPRHISSVRCPRPAPRGAIRRDPTPTRPSACAATPSWRRFSRHRHARAPPPPPPPAPHTSAADSRAATGSPGPSCAGPSPCCRCPRRRPSRRRPRAACGLRRPLP